MRAELVLEHTNQLQRILTLTALNLHEFKDARWLVLGFLVTETACSPLVCDS